MPRTVKYTLKFVVLVVDFIIPSDGHPLPAGKADVVRQHDVFSAVIGSRVHRLGEVCKLPGCFDLIGVSFRTVAAVERRCGEARLLPVGGQARNRNGLVAIDIRILC
ncbi:hypothetical protein SDC9_58270 [bioreactor metagenome]|uniref:Uncharacterized protein n=1 Tax=bioreactor metagenome TaxID=1076179 RepID=A0A644X774_9ZZZZ